MTTATLPQSDRNASANPSASSRTRTVAVRVKRQNGPNAEPVWEEFAVPHRPNMNIISVLQWIAANPTTIEGKKTTPVVWDSGCLEEVCGACTMVVNGKVRQSCSALVDKLEEPIRLEAMTKFPVVRDLWVDRSRLFNDLKRAKAWVPIDGTYDLGPGPAQSEELQQERYPLSRCISCGCCLEACPQYTPTNGFVGAAVISQVRLFNDHPTGAAIKDDRLEFMKSDDGVSNCSKAGNCVQVCPKDIPLLESIAAVQRQCTIHTVKKFFQK
ncbi:MAG: succinate dehydrogenase iron-sulfur subunit [Phycisphaerae bacterium]